MYLSTRISVILLLFPCSRLYQTSPLTHMKKNIAMLGTLVMGWHHCRHPVRFQGKETIKTMYAAHKAYVRRTVPDDRSPVLRLGEFNWKELCDLLNSVMLNTLYPPNNSTLEFGVKVRRLLSRQRQHLCAHSKFYAIDDLRLTRNNSHIFYVCKNFFQLLWAKGPWSLFFIARGWLCATSAKSTATVNGTQVAQ